MRVFLLGLDGATFDLILPWAREGRLPNIAALLKHSNFGELESLPPITPAGWTSMITGVNCGKHGLADFLKLNSRTYQLSPTSRLDRKVETVYNILGNEGKRVIVLSYPMTYPAEEVNGFLVTGLQTPKIDEKCSYPPGLISTLERELGDIRFMVNHTPGMDRSEFLSDIKELTRARERMTLHFIKNHEFDFFTTVFMATDIVSHAFWKYMDERYPGRENIPEEELNRYENAIREVYEQIDDCVGKIIEALKGTNTVIILASDHGSGPLYKFFNINRFLAEKGYMTLAEGDERGERNKLIGAVSRLLNGIRGRRKRGKNESGGRGQDEYFREVVWDKTRAYSWGNLCSINLNLAGREELGTVHPGETAALRKSITDDLMALVDERGKKIVDAVGFSRDVFHGPYAGDLPDMYMVMQDITYVGRGVNPVYRDIAGKPLMETADLSGTHRINGIYAVSDICARKGLIRRGISLKLTGKKYKIYDIAPTILKLLGTDVPENFDGYVMESVFSS